MSEHDPASTPATFWEERYGSKPQIWSGRVNAPLADVAVGLEPGTALDLGCGEGADAIWLAEQGWAVTAVDISATALERGAREAARVGVADRISWQQHDLGASFPDGSFDLVCAQYLHSPVELPRDDVLRRGASAVAPGGTLLVVGHAEPPPWAGNHHDHDHDHDHGNGHDDHHDHEVRFPTPDEVVDALALRSGGWTVLRCETVERDAEGPGGTRGRLRDSVVVARRD